VRQSQAFTTYSEKYVPARQSFTAHRRTSVACSVGRLHLLTLAPFELRLVAQIVASDDTAPGTRSQHLSFVERQAARRTGSRHSPAQLRPRDTSVPGKPDHTVGTETFRDDTNHSYICRPERTYALHSWRLIVRIRMENGENGCMHCASVGVRSETIVLLYIQVP